jgi:hypothetical protein
VYPWIWQTPRFTHIAEVTFDLFYLPEQRHLVQIIDATGRSWHTHTHLLWPCNAAQLFCAFYAFAQDGDLINIDVTVYLNGYHGDNARNFYVGELPVCVPAWVICFCVCTGVCVNLCVLTCVCVCVRVCVCVGDHGDNAHNFYVGERPVCVRVFVCVNICVCNYVCVWACVLVMLTLVPNDACF